MASSTMMVVMLTHDFLRDESTHLQPSTCVTRGVGVGYTGGLSLLILRPSAGYTIVFHLKIHHTVHIGCVLFSMCVSHFKSKSV